MRKDQLEHLIRAAGEITGEREILIIGSQAILATIALPFPALLTRSAEGDFAFPDERLADLVDANIGENSPFHEQYGFFAQGVTPSTAKLPSGWEERLIPVCNENTGGYTGLCLEIHDLAVSKLAAGRPKDLEFVEVLVQERYVLPALLLERAEMLKRNDPARGPAIARVKRLTGLA